MKVISAILQNQNVSYVVSLAMLFCGYGPRLSVVKGFGVVARAIFSSRRFFYLSIPTV